MNKKRDARNAARRERRRPAGGYIGEALGEGLPKRRRRRSVDEPTVDQLLRTMRILESLVDRLSSSVKAMRLDLLAKGRADAKLADRIRGIGGGRGRVR